MDLLDSIDVRGRPAEVQLWRGDLTTLSEAEAVDLLVVSAFPGDYIPTRGSLIGALERKGLSVGMLALDKDVDLTGSFSCWLSKEFEPPDPGLRFRRILCFEPLRRGEPPEVVGDIFRALIPVLAEKPEIRVIALPLVAAGDQGFQVEEMTTSLVDAGLHWLENGLALDVIRVVAYRDAQAQVALEAFSKYKRHYCSTTEGSGPAAESTRTKESDYDVLMSYSRANVRECEQMVRLLQRSSPDIRVFLDQHEISIGAPWPLTVFESVDRCRRVVVMLSPAYLTSKVCLEEFNVAFIRSLDVDGAFIFPVLLYTTILPSYMKRNYFDCREGDSTKIAAASARLLGELAEG